MASPGRQRTCRLAVLGYTLGPWRFLRGSVRRTLLSGNRHKSSGAYAYLWEVEKLSQVPFAEGFLAPLSAPGFSRLCCSRERMYLGFFSLQSVGQGQFKQSCFHFCPSGTHVVTQFTQSDAENFFFLKIFLPFFPELGFWLNHSLNWSMLIALMWVQENGRKARNRWDNENHSIPSSFWYILPSWLLGQAAFVMATGA